MSDSGLTAGKEIDGKCTKCKMVTGHTIVAMVDDEPKRVKCNTCGSQHRFIVPPEAPKSEKASMVVRKGADGKKKVTMKKKPAKSTTKGPAKKRSTRKAPPSPEDVFDQLCAGKELSAPTPYSPGEYFMEEQIVQHSAFGIGVVTRTRGGSKMDVHFRSVGPKILIHGR